MLLAGTQGDGTIRNRSRGTRQGCPYNQGTRQGCPYRPAGLLWWCARLRRNPAGAGPGGRAPLAGALAGAYTKDAIALCWYVFTCGVTGQHGRAGVLPSEGMLRAGRPRFQDR